MIKYKQAGLLIIILAVLFSGCSKPVSKQSVVKIGNTMDEVKRVLGSSRGTMIRGDKIIWLYEKGYVEFNDGVVVLLNFKTKENLAGVQAGISSQTEEETAGWISYEEWVAGKKGKEEQDNLSKTAEQKKLDQEKSMKEFEEACKKMREQNQSLSTTIKKTWKPVKKSRCKRRRGTCCGR